MRRVHSLERGEGIPLVLIHGAGVDHRIMLPLDPVIAANGGWRRVYLDLPGMGKSPAGPEIDGTEAVLAAVTGFLRDTLGGARFAVLGDSYGGMIARALAARLGDRVLGLGLLCPAIVADRTHRTLPPRTVLREDPALLASLGPRDAAEYAEMAVVQSAENWALFRDHVLPGIRCADQEALDRIAPGYALPAEPEDVAEAFPNPTLVVTGRQDHVVGFADAAALLGHYPRATFAVLDGAGHNAHLDRPGPVAALVDDWLSRVKAIA